MEDKILDPDMNSFAPQKNKYIPYSTIGSGFELVGLYLGTVLFVVLLFLLVPKSFRDAHESLINFLSYTISMGLLLVFTILQRKGYSFSTKNASVMVFFMGMVTVLSTGIFLEPLVNLIPMPDWFSDIYNKMVTPDIFSFVTVVIAAPIIEELIFRGILLDGMLKRYQPIKAIFWSSFIFGIIHFNPWQFFGALIIGMIIGWVYWKTQSIWPCIIMHLVNNMFGFLFIIFSDTSGFTFNTLKNNDSFLYIYLFSIPVLVLSLFLLKKVLDEKE